MTEKKGALERPVPVQKTTMDPGGAQRAIEKWVSDLEIIFEKSMEAKKFSVALKAKELLAKNQGWISGGVASTPRTIKSIDQWTLQEIQDLILQLDAYEDKAE
jgi:hypothetical protein